MAGIREKAVAALRLIQQNTSSTACCCALHPTYVFPLTWHADLLGMAYNAAHIVAPQAPFFVIGTSSTTPLVECRQLPASPPTLGQGCGALLGASTSYTVPAVPPNALPSTFLYGCAAPSTSSASPRCLSGFLHNYLGSNLQSCTLGPFCNPNTERVLYSATGAVVGCGSAATCSATPYSGGVAIFLSGASTQTGCMALGADGCPAGFNFAWWVAPTSGRTPRLFQW